MTRDEQLRLMSDLRNVAFRRKRYKQWSPEWDHDHCSVCWAKFSERNFPDVLHEGYATAADYEHGEDYDWICQTCFMDFQGEMGWRLLE